MLLHFYPCFIAFLTIYLSLFQCIASVLPVMYKFVTSYVCVLSVYGCVPCIDSSSVFVDIIFTLMGIISYLVSLQTGKTWCYWLLGDIQVVLPCATPT
jgi:hypothetical protein